MKKCVKHDPTTLLRNRRRSRREGGRVMKGKGMNNVYERYVSNMGCKEYGDFVSAHLVFKPVKTRYGHVGHVLFALNNLV